MLKNGGIVVDAYLGLFPPEFRQWLGVATLSECSEYECSNKGNSHGFCHFFANF
jgi:hypothetical protein